jgi:hypothetical protein
MDIFLWTTVKFEAFALPENPAPLQQGTEKLSKFEFYPIQNILWIGKIL